ncbi:MAG: helix-turn-helix domain-containing protein [Dethiobacteria bacterium]|jgi:transcriptional regulator with XRE-family HTH domain
MELRGNKTLREVAEKAGISHTYLGVLEKGIDPRSGKQIKPSTDTLERLAKAYKYPYEKLLKAAGYLYNDDNKSTDAELEDFLRNSNVKFNGAPLDDEDKEDIIGFLKMVWKRKKQKT